MATVSPFYSSKHPNVYHTCSKCTEGNNIESGNKTSGTGGLPKCSRCKDLTASGDC